MQCSICGNDAWYVCGRTGRPVCPQHSRIEVVSRVSFGLSGSLSVREASSSDYKTIGQLAQYFWDKPSVTRFGKEYDVLKLPAYVVSASDHVAGVLSYSLETECLSVVMLNVLPGYQGLGGGKMLLDAAKEKASAEKKSTILASISNDDLPSLYFYQRNGFQIYEVKPERTVERQGKLHVGFAGIPSRDEIFLCFKV